MKAVVVKKYGAPEVLHMVDVETPTPKGNEVLIKIHTATVTSGDCRLRARNVPFGFGLIMRVLFGWTTLRQPILGAELAGVIVAAGDSVNEFNIGDPVFAFPDFKMGCYAEYICMAEDAKVVLKPENLSFDEAAALSFGGTTALDFFRRAKLVKGERVLINGASGAVGIAAVQLAKHSGAHVTGVCSAANADLVKSLGADEVIDYTAIDFTRNGETYDVMMDAVGNAPFARCKNSLKPNGRMLIVVADLLDMLQAPWVAMTSTRKVIAGPVTSRVEDLQLLASLAAAGKYRLIIDRRYQFNQIVQAHRYVDSGRKRGNVLIAWDSNALDTPPPPLNGGQPTAR